MAKNPDPADPPVAGEFELIADLLAPLAADFDGAFGLLDDGAVVPGPDGYQWVVTKDMMVEGVHFLSDEEPGRIARKLLRVNVSDLAAMGARPAHYLLGLAMPRGTGREWLRGFTDGLGEDQALFGMSLAGGDTVATDGPLTVSLTALGRIEEGQALRRSGAAPGQRLYVSGTIGDAALGLAVAKGEIDNLSPGHLSFLEHRYRLPRPRMALGLRLPGLARAAIDVSDGVVADLGHICETSGVGAEIRLSRLPLSDAARAAVEACPDLLNAILTGGDDYELLFTVDAGSAGAVAALSSDLGLELTEIGAITEGRKVSVFDQLDKIRPNLYEGYKHF